MYKKIAKLKHLAQSVLKTGRTLHPAWRLSTTHVPKYLQVAEEFLRSGAGTTRSALFKILNDPENVAHVGRVWLRSHSPGQKDPGPVANLFAALKLCEVVVISQRAE